MDQPLDLSLSNHEMMKKKTFTIEYLTSDIPKQFRPPLIIQNQSLPMDFHPVENPFKQRFCVYSKSNEHVVPNICSPRLTVSIMKEGIFIY